MRKSCLIPILILVVSSCAGCLFSTNDSGHKWTVMVYMAGDSSLSSFVDSNLAEIESVGSSVKLNVLVLSDKSGEGDSHLLYVKRNSVKDLSLKDIWIKRPNEIETGREETLNSFLNFSYKKYPADYHMLIIWGHGSGWKGAAEDGGDLLTLPEMKSGLTGFHLDILAFDACSMGNLESYFELESFTKFIVASEKTIPTAGWPYRDILNGMTEKSPDDIGRMIVKKYVNAYATHEKDPESFSIEMSLLKTGTGLSQSFVQYATIRNDLSVQLSLRFEEQDCADLISVVNDTTVLKMLGKTVIEIERWNNPSSSMNVSKACGLSVYLPVKNFDGEYNETDLAQDTNWVETIVATLNNTSF